MIISWALHYALAAVALALLLTGWRLLRGPTLLDRVLALDTLYVNALGLVLLLGLRRSSPLLFEAAVVIALLGFVSTVALARFVARGRVMD